MLDEEKFYSELIKELKTEQYLTPKEINLLKISLAKKYNIKSIVKNAQILAHTPDEDREKIIKILNNKPVRELSGVTVVALFAKPHSCPHGKCMYCPGGPGSPFGDTPQSYTGKEPAALRAIRNNYDPYLQIWNRLEHYIANGHDPDKLELIFMGGTFPSLDKEYRDQFVYYVYKAINDFGNEFFYLNNGKRQCNFQKFINFFEMKGDFSSQERQNRIHEKCLILKEKNAKEITEKNLEEEIRKNETALIRAIGLTIETKPDWAMEEHCNDMLRYGCTRLEVGVQTLNEDCLKKTNRGHTLEDTKRSFQIMKDMCFKINAHMMLGLPASTLDIDKQSLIDLFALEPYRPDMLKIYPCLVVEGTPLYNMYKLGKFEPITTQKAAQIIAQAYPTFPRYVRVMRVQRDIPTTVVEGGVSNSNLRQYVEEEMKKLHVSSKDIRAREIGLRQREGYSTGEFNIHIEEFLASKGKEFFIDVVDEQDTMIGFIRLRFPKEQLRPEITSKTALIRELHIYGQTVPVSSLTSQDASQHKGWGTRLVKKAEEIAKENGYTKMAIISGVGVREYYRKLGYELEGPYMVKNL
jgi:elongator complex protein 3